MTSSTFAEIELELHYHYIALTYEFNRCSSHNHQSRPMSIIVGDVWREHDGWMARGGHLADVVTAPIKIRHLSSSNPRLLIVTIGEEDLKFTSVCQR